MVHVILSDFRLGLYSNMDNSNSKRIDIVERAMIDANQNETNQNDDIFGTQTSAVSDVVPPRRGRPRGRPRKVTEKSQETVKNNGIP